MYACKCIINMLSKSTKKSIAFTLVLHICIVIIISKGRLLDSVVVPPQRISN